MDQSLGRKIDKDAGHSLVQIRGGHLGGNEKGKNGIIIRWIDENSKRC